VNFADWHPDCIDPAVPVDTVGVDSMMLSWWMWLVVGTVVGAVIGALRWAITDFLLDQFGSRRTEWSPRRDRERFESQRAGSEP
jgi:hypothetical protein